MHVWAVGVGLTHNAEITEPAELVMAALRGGSSVAPVAESAPAVERIVKAGVKGKRSMPKRRPK